MKYLLGLAFLLGFSFLAHAEPITFTFINGSINNTQLNTDGNWQSIGGIRVKTLPTGMPDSTDPNSLGLLWAASTAPPNNSQYFIVLTGEFCLSGRCAIGTLTGVLSSSPEGLRWTTPPPSITLFVNGGFIYLTSITNEPNGIYSSTRDLNVKGYLVTAETPEPVSLILLGTGLAAMARKFRKRKD